jgi:hypothetical protein
MDRYRIIHKISGEAYPDSQDDDDIIVGFESTTYIWKGEYFPTRAERARAFLCSILIMKKPLPEYLQGLNITHEGPILQELYVKKKPDEWRRGRNVLAWRNTSDELKEPKIVGDPNNS